MNKKRIIDNALIIAMIIVVALFVAPYLWLAFYANIAQDDICFLDRLLSIPAHSFVSKEVNFIIDEYNAWQGTYFTNMLIPIVLLPFWKFGNGAVQVELFVIILMWFSSLFLLVYSLVTTLFEKIGSKFFVSLVFYFSILVVILLKCSNIKDVFYWLNGSIAYTLPCSFSFLTISLLLLEKIENNKVAMIMCSILAFLSVGGALNVSAFSCGAILLCCVWNCIREKRSLIIFLPFLVAFLGSIINVIAPGNYNRHTETIATNSILIAIEKSVFGIFERNQKLLQLGAIQVYIIAIVIAWLFVKNLKIRYINPAFLGFILFIGEVIVDFPVWLGVDHFEDRTEFLGRTVDCLFLFIFLLNLIGWLVHYFGINMSKYRLGLVISICILLLIPSLVSLERSNVYPLRIYDDIINGTLQKYENANDYMFECLESSEKNVDLVIVVKDYPRLNYVKGTGVLEDPDTWINRPLSRIYGLNSLSVIYE